VRVWWAAVVAGPGEDSARPAVGDLGTVAREGLARVEPVVAVYAEPGAHHERQLCAEELVALVGEFGGVVTQRLLDDLCEPAGGHDQVGGRPGRGGDVSGADGALGRYSELEVHAGQVPGDVAELGGDAGGVGVELLLQLLVRYPRRRSRPKQVTVTDIVLAVCAGAGRLENQVRHQTVRQSRCRSLACTRVVEVCFLAALDVGPKAAVRPASRSGPNGGVGMLLDGVAGCLGVSTRRRC
jgi:hypothetical protein